MIDLTRLIAWACIDLFTKPAKPSAKRKSDNLPELEHGIFSKLFSGVEKIGLKNSKLVFVILASFSFAAMVYREIHPLYCIAFMVIGFSTIRGWEAFLLALKQRERRRDHAVAVEDFQLFVKIFSSIIRNQSRSQEWERTPRVIRMRLCEGVRAGPWDDRAWSWGMNGLP
jgi:hypothetical protein